MSGVGLIDDAQSRCPFAKNVVAKNNAVSATVEQGLRADKRIYGRAVLVGDVDEVISADDGVCDLTQDTLPVAAPGLWAVGG